MKKKINRGNRDKMHFWFFWVWRVEGGNKNVTNLKPRHLALVWHKEKKQSWCLLRVLSSINTSHVKAESLCLPVSKKDSVCQDIFPHKYLICRMKKLLVTTTPTRYCYIQFVYACFSLAETLFFICGLFCLVAIFLLNSNVWGAFSSQLLNKFREYIAEEPVCFADPVIIKSHPNPYFIAQVLKTNCNYQAALGLISQDILSPKFYNFEGRITLLS